MKFMDFNRNIKDNLVNVYQLVGDDYFLVKQTIHNLKSYLIKDFEEFNYVMIDGEKVKRDELDASISTLPMGSDHRLVVLDKPNKDAVKLIGAFDFTDTGIVVACIGGEKVSNALEIDCSKMDRTDISKYIVNYFAKCNLKITEEAMDYIIDSCNQNMTIIVNELNKIVSFAIGKSTVDIGMVTNLTVNSVEYVTYMLTSAIDNKNFGEYQKIINEMSKAQTFGDIFSYMGKYFRRMQYISLSKNDDELSKILGIKPYAIKMSRQSINKNGINYYLGLYQKYVDLDYKIKSGKISAKNALYELVF